MKEVVSEIEKKIGELEVPDPVVDKFVEYFLEKFGDSLLAVVLYGSMISPKTRKPTSFHDFFTIVDSYTRAFRSIKDILLSKFLPPNVYMGEIEFEGERKICKYNVISWDDFENAILAPQELFIPGRFSKRVYVAWVKERKFFKKIAQLCAEAQYFCLTWTIPLLDDAFDIEKLVKEVLSLSYKGEVRIESPTKVDEIFEADREWYLKVYSKLFEIYQREYEGVVGEVGEGVWKVIGEPIPSQQEAIHFLKISARKAMLRWPKGLITFKGYREYLEGKAQRSGEDIKVSPLDRKFPLIFGWRHVIRLVLQGKLKSGIAKELEVKRRKEI